MKTENNSLGTLAAAIIIVLMTLLVLSQLLNFWWLLITGIFSSAIWLMIWLWPGRVTEKVEIRKHR